MEVRLDKDSKKMWCSTTPVCMKEPTRTQDLASKPVQSPALSLQCIDHIHGRHSLAPRVLGVRHSIPDHVLQKYFEHTTSLFVNKPTDTLHTSSSRQAPDGGFSDTLNVVSQHLPMTLGATLPQALTSFTASRHG